MRWRFGSVTAATIEKVSGSPLIHPAGGIRKLGEERLEARIGAERFEVRIFQRLCRRRLSLFQCYSQEIQSFIGAAADCAIAGAVVFALALYQAAGGVAVGGGLGILAELSIQAGESIV